MRYPASEKLEIIRLVERSHLPVLRTLGIGLAPLEWRARFWFRSSFHIGSGFDSCMLNVV